MTSVRSLGIYAGVSDSQISSAPLWEMFKMEGLAAAGTVQVCLPGQKSGAVGIAVSQQEKPSQEEMWDGKGPWCRGTWGAGSNTPAAHGAALWAQSRWGTATAWPRHGMAMAPPRQGHGPPTAWPWHRMGIAWPQHG